MSDQKHEGQELIRSIGNDIVPGEYWTHYKGGVYQIVTLGVKEDTGDVVVVYKSLKHTTVWVRTVANWCEQVELPTGTVPRFKKGAP